MYIKRFQPFLVHLGLWIIFYISFISFKIDLTLLLIILLPITVADLWLAFTLVLMLRLPRQRSQSEIPHGWISEEQDGCSRNSPIAISTECFENIGHQGRLSECYWRLLINHTERLRYPRDSVIIQQATL